MKEEGKNLTLAKVLLVFLAATLSTLVFGLCVPFLLIALNIIPNLGLGSLTYVILGGLGGLLFGSIASSISLFRSDKLFTHFYIRFLVFLAALIITYFIFFLSMPEAFASI
ncbi:MAG: hypothetical protein MK078_11065 [Crocinitomicaceae bacterium]|nr:hypothetical protein [Crocinitomicaceae bacterium]